VTGARERGSASIWVVTCCALLTVVASVVTIRSLAVLARHRAEGSADLAALAAAGRIGVASDECATAARVAERNDARLLECRVRCAADGRSGTVTVRVGLPAQLPLVGVRQVVATARAARERYSGPGENRVRFVTEALVAGDTPIRERYHTATPEGLYKVIR
jgi:secretion/DNA translocation related TadE-like protein